MKSTTSRIALILFAILLAGPAAMAQAPLEITIDADGARTPISPYIYGINAYVYDPEWGAGDWKVGLDNVEPGLNITARRLGGNTMTTYNWENGFSNSGIDDAHANSIYQSYITGAGSGPYGPGAALATFHDHSLQLGTYSLLQLPAAGYLAADNNGPVPAADIAPSPRFKRIAFDKVDAYTLSPDPNDDVVYIDEEMNFLIDRYGRSTEARGIRGYELDNEPGLWHHYPQPGDNQEGTHSLAHPEQTGCGEVLIKNQALASMIRRMDSDAEIFGPAMWGYAEMYSLWAVYDGRMIQPHDWGTYNIEPWTTNNTGDRYRYNGMTWMNAYLAGMKDASDGEGRRLLDVFSFHYYPDAGAVATDALRMQAPRSLWDPTYVEPSWITQDGNGFTDGRSLEMLPKVRRSIEDFYPGTRIGITEYSFGGRHTVAGGIAQADALGIFGRQGVYLATCFVTIDDYVAAAFRIYRNYDGQNSTFGDNALATTISDIDKGSAYSSIDQAGRIHLVVINKENRAVDARIAISSAASWNRAEAYGFGSASPAIRRLDDPVFEEDGLAATLAPLSVTHIVIVPGMGAAADDEATVSGARLQVLPNPIVESGTLRVTLPASGEMALRLYDMLGNEAGTIADGWRSEGEHDIHIDAVGLADGYYTVRLEAGGIRLAVPLIITR